jgi:hypothetical protein
MSYTHAIFTEDGRFKDWIYYISGQYELKRGDWYTTMASELETFLSNEHLVVPFDELTDDEWIVIRNYPHPPPGHRQTRGDLSATAVR